MARITVEDCLEKVNNRFALIHMAAKRVRQLRKGVEPLIASKNRDVVISLREIAGGYIKRKEPPAQDELLEKEGHVPTEEPGKGGEVAAEVEKGVDVPTKEPGKGVEVAAEVEKEVDVPTEEPGEGGEVAAEVEKETTVEEPEGE